MEQHKGPAPSGRKLFTNVETISVGIDWLTVTAGEPGPIRALLNAATKRRGILERLGETNKKGAFQGYVGQHTGPLFIGARQDGILVKESGGTAEELFGLVDWTGVHCSRIDLQATVRLPEYDPTIAQELRVRRAAAKADKDGKLKPRQEYIGREGNGDELRIGSRESPRYGRVYDKQAQSGDERYLRAWRFEVEFKKVMAPKIVEYLTAAPSRHGAIVEALIGQFTDWGIEIPIVGDGVLVAGSIGRREFNTDRAMTWLRSQVAPSVERLLGTVSQEDILDALGLRGPDRTPAALARRN